MAFPPSNKFIADSPTTKHFPKYKDFLFDRTVTLYIGPDNKRIEMHKNLLASISPELNRHANNDMREGIEGVIRLPDEKEEALMLFTEWAYSGDYDSKDDTPLASTSGRGTKKKKNPLLRNPWPSLHKHLQLCVFGDKFNVPILQQLAESKFHTEIKSIEPKSERDATGLAMVIGYAYGNLPSSDPILKFLAQYAAWKLELLRPTTSFNQLILAQPDFLKELLMNLEGPRVNPTTTAPQEDLAYDDYRPSDNLVYIPG